MTIDRLGHAIGIGPAGNNIDPTKFPLENFRRTGHAVLGEQGCFEPGPLKRLPRRSLSSSTWYRDAIAPMCCCDCR